MHESQRQHESQQILEALGRVLRRRKLLLILCLVVVLGPVLYYNETTPPVYEATVSLVFEETGALVPSDVLGAPMKEHHLYDRIEEINSRAFADDVAAALPQRFLSRFIDPENLSAGADLRKEIGDQIHGNLSAYPVRNSNIVRIRVQMTDPELCMVIADLSLKVLEERSSRIRHEGVTDLRKFIENQLLRFNVQLQEAESNLKDFKERSGITSLTSESSETLRKMTEAEVLLNTARANREAAEERLAAVGQALSEQRRGLVPAVTNIASPSAQKLKEKLVDLQTQYAQLVVQAYQANHPQLVRLQQEIDQTKKALTDEALKVAAGGNVGDPIAQIERYVDESVSLQIDIESHKARENALRQTVDQYRRLLGGLPTRELELARLVRERDVNEKIYTTLLERREEVRISEAKQIPSLRIIDRAELPSAPILPRKKLNLMAGTVLALVLGMGLGFFVESLGSKLDSMIGFEKETGWSVLALVPRMGNALPTWIRGPWRERRGTREDIRKALVSHLDPHSAPGESYFMLRTRLELLGVGIKYRSLLVTSTGPGDGKSSTLSNLAAAFGAAGRATLVIDAELRRPVIHSFFRLDRKPGLTDLLAARHGGVPGHRVGASNPHGPSAGRASALSQDGALFRETEVEGVTVLTSGESVRNVRWEMSRGEMRALLDELKQRFDVVLVDSASPILVHDTLILAGIVDAVLVVVDAHSYDADRLMETKRLLEQAGANVVGAVVNKVDPGGRYGYYYSHYYSHQAS